MSLNSNAFNFASFVQNGVDPRTGQYTLGIELPELIGNNLSGPRLPLRLAFSPMNDQDAGFGIGWGLNLSQFARSSGILSLSSGESFKVADNGPGQEPVIAERKLDSFHFHNESDPDKGLVRYRVVHKAGLEEVLEPQPGNTSLALPVRLLAPSGHGLTLAYERRANQTRLVSVTDDTGRQLLAIDHTSNSEVLIDLHPGQPATARYTLKRQGDELRAVVLPSDEQPSWRFAYQRLETVRCVSRVDNPLGGTERIYHLARGHRFPPDDNGQERWLPYVERHVVQPGAGQPEMVTLYRFGTQNFLGYGSSIVWSDDGLDNLYKFAGSSYIYDSITEYLGPVKNGGPDGVVRTIKRSFNRFHLLTEQVTEQEGCVETVTTRYHEHEQPGISFKDQPPELQLPSAVSKAWRLSHDPRPYREEHITTRYDAFGNLVEEVQANGIRTAYTYYPAEPDPGSGCPTDPHGFVRNLQSLTVHPASIPLVDNEKAAQTTRVHYRYQQLDALPPAAGHLPQPGWLERHEEQMFDVQLDEHGNEREQLLQRTERVHINNRSNPLLHGRIDYQTTLLGTSTARDQWRYTTDLPNQLSTTQTHTAPGGTLQRRIKQIHDIATSGLLQDQDLNGVISRYRYDQLNRLVEETIAPDTPNAASRSHAYRLLAENDRGPAYEEVTDVNGVLTRTYQDGASRTLYQQLHTPKLGTLPVHYRARYDSLGRQSGETYYDHYDENQTLRTLELDYSFTYDGWGERCSVVRPDGTREHREFSPFGKDGNKITTWVSTPTETAQRSQEQVSEYNRFDKPVYDYRLDGQQTVGRNDYRYDGLGRCIEQTLTLQATASTAAHARSHQRPHAAPAASKRTTRYLYDVWGRMYESHRPDGSVLQRHFAANSINELTTLFQVRQRPGAAAKPICERQFDALERLTRMNVGPRVEEYSYKADQDLLHQHTAYRMEKGSPSPERRILTYTYNPNLTEQPSAIEVLRERAGKKATSNATFSYRPDNAAIASATNTQGKRNYQYTELGQLHRETWQDAAGDHHYDVEYQHSPQDRLLWRKDSDGQVIEHRYDTHGRLASTRQGPLLATLGYNAEGLLHTTDTVDENSGRHVHCELFYDAHGRETQRNLSVDADTPHELHLVWRDDDLLLERRLKRDSKELLTEYFEYDELDRLAFHDSFGPNLPCNAKGRAIVRQQFDFDEQDNLTRCRTWFADGEQDDADFVYKSDGSFQLESVSHSLSADYPAHQGFSYDELGNALNDEWGRRLVYDDLGRLLEVRDAADDSLLLASYRYDGHDQLLAARHGSAAEVLRRYQGYQVDSTLQDGLLTQYLYNGDIALGQNLWQGDTLQDSRLLLADAQGSFIGEYDSAGLRPSENGVLRPAAYSAYGERPEDNGLRTLLGFVGELRDQALGWYLLGRGYRAYNPNLMRFHSPDSLAPEDSGINPYLYCLGNPTNWRDPTGHRTAYGYGKENPTDRSYHPPYIDPPEEEKRKRGWADWLGVGIAGLFLVISAITMPWSAPLSIGYVVAVAGLGMQAAGMGLQVAAMYEDDPNKVSTHLLLANTLQIAGGLAFSIGQGVLKTGIKAAQMTANGNGTYIVYPTTIIKFTTPARAQPLSRSASLPNLSTTARAPIRQVASAPGSPGPAVMPPASSAGGSPGVSAEVLTARLQSVAESQVRAAIPATPTPPSSSLSLVSTFKQARAWPKVGTARGLKGGELWMLRPK